MPTGSVAAMPMRASPWSTARTGWAMSIVVLEKVVWQLWAEVFDGVCLMAAGDEGGVIGLDNDEVIDTEQSDFAILTGVEDDVVLGVDFGDFGVGFVFFALSVEVFGDGNPGADVVPVEGGLDVEHAGGFFHEGVVDGDGAEARKLLGDGLVDVWGGLDLIDEVGELRGVLGEFLCDGVYRPDEHARIPGEVALSEEFLGEFGVGFFAEASDFMGRVV